MSPLAAARKADWVLFVAAANAAEGDASPAPELVLCTTVARLMAEAIGAVRPIDYSDAAMRDMLIAALKPGAKPFAGDSSAEWRDFAIKPCHINMALRTQSRAMEAFGRKAPAPLVREDAGRRTACRQEGQQSAPAEAAAKPAEETTRIAAAMEEYVKASKELLEEKREKPLAFAMEARRVFACAGGIVRGYAPRQDRVREVWLGKFPREGLPTEESMRKFAAAGRTAQSHGRSYIGSAEGESLQAPCSAARAMTSFRFADCSARRTTASPNGRECRSWTRYQRGRARGAIARRPSPRRTARVRPWTEWIFSVMRTSRSRATQRSARAHARPVARGPRNGVGASLHPVQSV